MKLVILRENRAYPLEEALGQSLDATSRKWWASAIREAGMRWQSRLGTSSPPLTVRVSDLDGSLAVCATGIAGTFRLGAVEWTVVPKFIANGAMDRWEQSILTMVRCARPRTCLPTRRGRLGSIALKFVDHFSMAYADAVEAGAAGEPVHAYRTEEAELHSVRGKVLIDRQLQHLFNRPQQFSCAFDELNVDNPVNHLLRWAVEQFSGLSQSSEVQRALFSAGQRLPSLGTAARLPVSLPVRLPPQYASWGEAVELATLLALGQTLGGTGTREGYGFVIDVAKVFEQFIDVSLRRGFARQTDADWQCVAQHRKVFAEALTPRTRSYWTRPDDTVIRNGRPLILVDSKYKLLADAEDGSSRRPSNSDVYQLACSVLAHGVSHGLLVYPQVVTTAHDAATYLAEGERKSWKVQIGSRTIVIGAVAIDVCGLASPLRVQSMEDLLVKHARGLLAETG